PERPPPRIAHERLTCTDGSDTQDRVQNDEQPTCDRHDSTTSTWRSNAAPPVSPLSGHPPPRDERINRHVSPAKASVMTARPPVNTGGAEGSWLACMTAPIAVTDAPSSVSAPLSAYAFFMGTRDRRSRPTPAVRATGTTRPRSIVLTTQ